MIREIRKNDLYQLKEIHQKFYENEFNFPDFFENFLCVFTVVDDNDNIISTGGVRTIIEAVAITDKDKSVRARRVALYELLAASQYVINRSGYNELHAFIQDPIWREHLIKAGFVPTKGNALVIGT